jgi:hypothetical protein
MLTFVLFPLALFFLGAALVTGLPLAMSLQNYYRNRGRQSAICPENGEAVNIELDSKYAFWTAWQGQEHTRLKSCTRWPEKGDCGQGCIEQIDPSPENFERLMLDRYKDKTCGICARPISPVDWRGGRLAWLDSQLKLVELREVDAHGLQFAMEGMRPLCWTCHQEERVRQAVTPREFKGDRHALAPAATRLSSEVEAL